MGSQRVRQDWATELTCMAMQVGKSDLKVPWSVVDQAESVETAALADEQLLQRHLYGACCTNTHPPRCGSNMGCSFWWERESQAQDALLRGQVSFYFKAPLSYSIWENYRRKVCNKQTVENRPLSPSPAPGDHPLSSHVSLECSPHTTRIYILWRQSFVWFCAQYLEQCLAFFYFYFATLQRMGDLSFPTRDRTLAFCSEGTEFQPLDLQGSPQLTLNTHLMDEQIQTANLMSLILFTSWFTIHVPCQ